EWGGDAEVVEIAAAAVVTSEDGGGEFVALADDGAETGVAGQDPGEFVGRFVRADAFAGVPKGEDFVVVSGGHRQQLEVGRHKNSEFRVQKSEVRKDVSALGGVSFRHI